MTRFTNRSLRLLSGILVFFFVLAIAWAFQSKTSPKAPEKQTSSAKSKPTQADQTDAKPAVKPAQAEDKPTQADTKTSQAVEEPKEELQETDTDLVFRYYHQLASENQGKNLFFSPWSISQALTLCYYGAKGQTLEEIQKALQIPDTEFEIKKLFSLSPKTQNAIQIATGVWLQKGGKIEENYIRRVEKDFQSDFRELDFKNDPEGSKTQINDWVKKKTKGMIPDFLANIDREYMILGSAIYFKGDWTSAFDPAQTKNGDFFTNPEKKESVSISMMSQISTFRNGASKLFRWIELPYKNTSLSMVIVLPYETTLEEVEENLNSDQIFDQLATDYETRLRLTMPRFSSAESYQLKPTLEAMGIRTAFSRDANFSGMTSKKVYLDKVQHKAALVVDEKGTEASAATTAHIMPKSVIRVDSFDVNQPFLYMILDTKEKKIYFIGRYLKPTK